MKTTSLLLLAALSACAPMVIGPAPGPMTTSAAVNYYPPGSPFAPQPASQATVTRVPWHLDCRNEGAYSAHYGVNPVVRNCYIAGQR